MRSRFSRVAVACVVLSTVLSAGFGSVAERQALAADRAEPLTTVPLAQGQFNTDELTDLAVTLSDTPDPVKPGEQLTYTGTVLNGANPFFSSIATKVQYTQKLPAGVTVLSVASTNGRACIFAGAGPTGRPLARVVCNLGLLSAGATATVTITVRVDPSLPTPTTLRSTAKTILTVNPTGDVNIDNNRATQSTAVVAP